MKMKSTIALCYGAFLRNASAPRNHPESENVPADSADGANWESEWIDLGGEG
jgi:hypothetical protein